MLCGVVFMFFFCKQKTAYEMRISDWSSDVCSSDLGTGTVARGLALRGCTVTALDHSAPLLAQAAELDRAAGVQVKQVRARVENADFPPASFDQIGRASCRERVCQYV